MLNKWTIERVKAELPDVPVRYNRDDPTDVLYAMCSGRKNSFATLSWKQGGEFRHCEASWGTVARVLNLPAGTAVLSA